MANRNFNRLQALEKEVKQLYADVAIGASGAPTLSVGLGIASVVRNSAGNYTVTLQDKYTRLMSMHVSFFSPSAQNLFIQLISEDVAGAKTVRFRVMDETSLEIDPAPGDRLLVKVDVKNSSV